jgi:hypothetical protein
VRSAVGPLVKAFQVCFFLYNHWGQCYDHDIFAIFTRFRRKNGFYSRKQYYDQLPSVNKTVGTF